MKVLELFSEIEKIALEQKHIDRIKDPNDEMEFWDLVDLGIVEFIDVNEENNCYIFSIAYFSRIHTWSPKTKHQRGCVYASAGYFR